MNPIKICWVLFLIFPLDMFGADPEKFDKKESLNSKRYTFGAIPALAFDSDLGIKYGAVVNIFHFGSDKLPPHYDQYLNIKLTNTTKGTLNAQALFESETLIRKSKLVAESSFFMDRKLDFFGFNGTNANYHRGFTDPHSKTFINHTFYSHSRRFLRLRFDLQKYLAGSRFRLLTGFTFNHFSLSTAHEKHGSNELQEPTLFEKYQNWGIIKPNEKTGGNINLLTIGLIYDSRNDPCYCTDGKWFEAMVVHSPGAISDHDFTRLIATYRQHTSISNNRITFSFRVSSQQKISGDVPFYILPTFFDSRLSQDGLGGAFSLRGAMRNRVVANGFITGNFEIKARVFDFSLLKQSFSSSIVGFYDNAFITQIYKVNLDKVPEQEKEVHFNQGKQNVHHTFGPGVYLVFNRNNIITINYGISTNKQLGSGGLYIGSSLLF